MLCKWKLRVKRLPFLKMDTFCTLLISFTPSCKIFEYKLTDEASIQTLQEGTVFQCVFVYLTVLSLNIGVCIFQLQNLKENICTDILFIKFTRTTFQVSLKWTFQIHQWQKKMSSQRFLKKFICLFLLD